MKRAKLNLLLDALMFFCIAAMSGIGLLMRNLLLPGYQRWEVYGRNVELFFLGMDRHQWGTIHFAIGLVFLTLLMIHIILHGQQVICIYRKLVPNRLGRWIIALIFVSLISFFFIFSYFVRSEVEERGRGRGFGHSRYESICLTQTA